MRLRVALLALTIVSLPGAALADEPSKPDAPRPDTPKADAPKGDAPDPGASTADKKAEARAHFDKGKDLTNEGAWSAALAEFRASRDLYPTWGNTLGVASTLRKLARFDEALDMFEILLRDFSGSLAADVRAAAQREIVELRGLVGTIDIEAAEISAGISIDGQSRGEYPAPGPLRVAAGTHVVRVSKEGFEPFEARVEVAGNQTARVVAKLRALAASGRLRVAEQGGAALDVIVDGNRVGTTPWEGALAPGEHVLLLQGEGDLGTPPVTVTVAKNDTAKLSLVAERLAARIRVEPEPISASVAIDSVTVGQGTWEGKLRAGKHRIEIAAPGFVAGVRDVTLAAEQHEILRVPLARDPSSPFWRKPPPPSHFLVELAGGVAIVPNFGGDIAGGCAGACDAAPGLGAYAALRVGYELPSGLAFGIAGATLFAEQRVAGRPASLQPVGTTGVASGAIDDVLAIRSSALVGPWIGFSFGERFPVRARAAVGPMFAWMGDTRSGTLSPVREGPSYAVGPLSVTRYATYLHVTPDVRVGYRVTRGLEINAGVDALILIALSDVAWDASRPINAGADGIGTFAAERFVGRVLVGVAPSIGARYDFF